MPVNLSIKNVPDPIAERLRQRAKRSHRSLQGELMVILEEAVYGEKKISPTELLEKVRETGLRTAATSASFVREDRDAR